MATITNSIVMRDRMMPVLNNISRALGSTLNALADTDRVGEKAFRDMQRNVRNAQQAVAMFNDELDGVAPEAERAASSLGKMSNPLQTAASLVYLITNGLRQVGKLTGAADKFINSSGRLRFFTAELEAPQMDPSVTKALQSALSLSPVIGDTSGLSPPGLANLPLTVDLTVTGEDKLAHTERQITDLQNKIFKSAQMTRTTYADMVDNVAQMGVVTKGIFKGNMDAVIRYTELLNKTLAMDGVKGQQADSVMLQLSQALAQGNLKGQEFNTLMANSPELMQRIADAAGANVTALKQMAADGELTSDILVKAMFMAANEIDEAFWSLPDSTEDVMNKIRNAVMMGARPIIKIWQDFLNSDNVQEFVSTLEVRVQRFFNNAIKKGTEFVHWVKENEHVVKGAIAAIGAALAFDMLVKIGQNTVGLIKMAKAAQEAGKILGLSFRTVGIFAVISAVVALGLYLWNLYKTNEEFRKKVEEVWNRHKGAIVFTLTAIALTLTTVYGPALITAGAQAITLALTTLKATTMMALGWIKVGAAFLLANWWILAIAAAVAIAIVNWDKLSDAGKALVIVIGAITAAITLWKIAQWALNAALIANPIGLVIMLVAALIAIIITVIATFVHLWKTNLEFKYNMIKVWISILNFMDQVPIFFTKVGNGIVEAMDKAAVSTAIIMQTMANSIIRNVNEVLQWVNLIAGTNFQAKAEVSWAEDAAGGAAITKVRRSQNLQQMESTAATKAADREAKRLADKAAEQAEFAAKQASDAAKDVALATLRDKLAGGSGFDDKFDWEKILDELGKPVELGGGKVDSIGKVDSDVSINEDDIKLLKDITKQDIVNRYTTLRPELKLEVGTIQETADMNRIIGELKTFMEYSVSTNLATTGG